MATVITTKSESGDNYVFVKDSTECTTLEDLMVCFGKEWYLDQGLYIENVSSQEFDCREITDAADAIIEENTEEY